MKNKTMTVWFAVNKNGYVSMYAKEPQRNEKTGKWDCNLPFINSLVYNQICQLVEKSGMDWTKEPECITFQMD